MIKFSDLFKSKEQRERERLQRERDQAFEAERQEAERQREERYAAARCDTMVQRERLDERLAPYLDGKQIKDYPVNGAMALLINTLLDRIDGLEATMDRRFGIVERAAEAAYNR